MLDALFFTKLSAVLTVLYAGLNLHQLTSSHAYLLEKIARFRAMLAEAQGAPGLVRLNLLFYVALPVCYLGLLSRASVAAWVLGAMAVKFALTALMDIRAERRIVAGGEYSRMQHAVGRADNVMNLAAAAGVIYSLLEPARLFR